MKKLLSQTKKPTPVNPMSLSKNDYNERLFTGGFRRRLHLSRFYWLQKSLVKLECKPESVFEIGCFDGKTIHYLPVKPKRYLGYDANWEGGLDLAKNNWHHIRSYEFINCKNPDDIKANELFDISICMETLEHLHPTSVNQYLEILSKYTINYSFMTFPNEIGILFSLKYLIKRMIGLSPEPYTFSEFINSSLGRTYKVIRNEHKGFNYKELLEVISKHFQIIELTALPFEWLPLSFGFSIAVIAKPKK